MAHPYDSINKVQLYTSPGFLRIAREADIDAITFENDEFAALQAKALQGRPLSIGAIVLVTCSELGAGEQLDGEEASGAERLNEALNRMILFREAASGDTGYYLFPALFNSYSSLRQRMIILAAPLDEACITHALYGTMHDMGQEDEIIPQTEILQAGHAPMPNMLASSATIGDWQEQHVLPEALALRPIQLQSTLAG